MVSEIFMTDIPAIWEIRQPALKKGALHFKFIIQFQERY